jgi:hypothetical protein
MLGSNAPSGQDLPAAAPPVRTTGMTTPPWRMICGQRWSNAGQTLVKRWSNAGQTAWSNTVIKYYGQILVKYNGQIPRSNAVRGYVRADALHFDPPLRRSSV